MLVFHCKCRKAEESSKINDFEYKKRLQFVNVILFCSKVIEKLCLFLDIFEKAEYEVVLLKHYSLHFLLGLLFTVFRFRVRVYIIQYTYAIDQSINC